MSQHTVFETTNMRAVYYAERIFDVVCDEDIDNGTFGYIEKVDDKHTDGVVYKFKRGTKAGEQIIVACNPEINEDGVTIADQRPDRYTNKAGTIFRAYALHKGDVFGITLAGFTDDTHLKDGAFVTINQTTGKLDAKDSTTSSAAFEGKIDSHRQFGATILFGQNQSKNNTLYSVRVTTLV